MVLSSHINVEEKVFKRYFPCRMILFSLINAIMLFPDTLSDCCCLGWWELLFSSQMELHLVQLLPRGWGKVCHLVLHNTGRVNIHCHANWTGKMHQWEVCQFNEMFFWWCLCLFENGLTLCCLRYSSLTEFWCSPKGSTVCRYYHHWCLRKICGIFCMFKKFTLSCFIFLLCLSLSSGHHDTVGQSHWAAAGLPPGPPQRERSPGAGETADYSPAERGAGQLPQAAVSAPAGAAALGEGEGAAPPASRGHRGQTPTEGGGVQTTGGEALCPTWGLWNSFNCIYMWKAEFDELTSLLYTLFCGICN